jgi:hypothetical protein
VVARIVREFGGLRVETTEWPIIVMVMPEHHFSDQDVQAALVHLEQVMIECRNDREKCVQVTDASRMHALPPASQRKITGEWIKKTVDLQKAVSLGGVNVTPSAIIRGIITAIHWFHKPETPVAFVATRNEAMLQAMVWLEQARVVLPPRLRELREKLTSSPQRDRPSGPGASTGAPGVREKQPSGWSWRR